MFKALNRIGGQLKSLAWPGGLATRGVPVADRRIGFIPADASGGGINLPLSGVDDCGPAWRNSCVAICANWIVANFTEADLAVEELDGDEWATVEGHEMVALLDDPAPGYPLFDFHSLWGGAVLPCLLHGN